MRKPRIKAALTSWSAAAMITAAVAVTVPFGVHTAGAAPVFSDFGSSSGSAGGGPAIGEARIFRTLQWVLPGGNSFGNTWSVTVDPEDSNIREGFERQCVNDRTGGFKFTEKVAVGREYTRSDDLWMLASQSWPICASSESKQSWIVRLTVTSNDGRSTRSWRSRIHWRYLSGRLDNRIISESSPALDVETPGAEIRFVPQIR